jgi:uncharacterized protein (TIGR03790 family)
VGWAPSWGWCAGAATSPHHPTSLRPDPVSRSAALVVALLALATADRAAAAGVAPAGVTPAELGLVINESDPLSRQIGEYYRVRRHIPAENVVHIHVPVVAEITALQFSSIKREVDVRLPARVQVLALAWTQPFRVSCMSVTSAFALGFDPAYCATGCHATPYSPYFNSDSHQPYTDFGIRPTMSLAADSLEAARALIDRGVAADGTMPQGSAYLLSTRDPARNVRQSSFYSAKLLERPGFRVDVVRSNELRNHHDVIFYFTGLKRVDGLRSNKFLPGAIADHLTSYGGVLIGSSQMSAMEWLRAGATGSYGTVVEPCALTAKFPSAPIVMRHYLAGETLIEAYWKSVATPSQGVFIGEPLAAPFRRH